MNKPFSEIIRGFRIDAQDAQKEKIRAEKRKLSILLMLSIPNNKKCKSVRHMAKLLIKDFFGIKEGVSNYLLAKYLGIKFSGGNPNLTLKKYNDDDRRFNELIENRFRTLKKHWNPNGYSVEFTKHSSRLIKLP